MITSSAARVLSALNLLNTDEGINYYHAIEALITDYFNEGRSNDESRLQ